MAGKPGRSGPKAGNVNALRTGSKVSKRRLTVGELPKELLSVRREGRAYRRTLESDVLAIKGVISTVDAHLIDTAAAATIQAGICRWLLRNKLGAMSTADVRGCTHDIVKAKERRDAAVKALALDAKPEPLTLENYVASGRTPHPLEYPRAVGGGG